MKIIKIIDEINGQNNYLVGDEVNAVLIDGGANPVSVKENLKLLGAKSQLRAIFLTHEHFDHISHLDELIDEFECIAYLYADAKPSLYKPEENMSILAEPFKIKEKKNIKTFKDGEEFKWGDLKLAAHHTPGHSQGSSVFVIEDNMFTGDTVFKVDVGRNDLFGGSEPVQKISLLKIKDVLSSDITNFYAGHGANFTKEELDYNIENFLKGEN